MEKFWSLVIITIILSTISCGSSTVITVKNDITFKPSKIALIELVVLPTLYHAKPLKTLSNNNYYEFPETMSIIINKLSEYADSIYSTIYSDINEYYDYIGNTLQLYSNSKVLYGSELYQTVEFKKFINSFSNTYKNDFINDNISFYSMFMGSRNVSSAKVFLDKYRLIKTQNNIPLLLDYQKSYKNSIYKNILEIDYTLSSGIPNISKSLNVDAIVFAELLVDSNGGLFINVIMFNNNGILTKSSFLHSGDINDFNYKTGLKSILTNNISKSIISLFK